MSTGPTDRFFHWTESRNPAVGMLVWMLAASLAVTAWSTGLYTLPWVDELGAGTGSVLSIAFIIFPLLLTAIGCAVMGAGMFVAALGITFITLLSTRRTK